MYSNAELAKCFASGKTKGKSNSMSIEGDTLYSYWAKIVIRCEDKFIISNRTSYLGGGTYSTTTSRHISLAIIACDEQKPIFLVEGWAERNKPEWFMPDRPTHKFVTGLIRGFNRGWGFDGWTGEWFQETGTKRVDWQVRHNKLYDPEGNIIAIRERVSVYAPCNKKCDICPAKFLCKTDMLPFVGYIFFIIKGTKHEGMVSKCLFPTSIIDYIPEGNIIRQ